jgi:putative ABC transport system permease protein
MPDALLRDVRYAIRVLRRTPAFTITAVGTLALVIGANSAVFSLADRILLRPLPYPHPERLAYVQSNFRGPGGSNTSTSADGFLWEALRDHSTKVDRTVFSGGGSGANLVVGSAALFVRQQRVGAGFFRVLGVPPLVGREFTLEEDRPNGPAVAILSHAMWRTLFGGDPSIVGKTILLRGEPCEVIGVMPEGFASTRRVDLWTPLRASTRGEGGGTNYGIAVRLKDGVTWAEAEADVRAAGDAALRRQGIPDTVQAWVSLVPMQQALVADLEQPIVMLGAAAVMVLLIACVNLAALLLARGGSRTRELATRMALGSGRAGIVRQLMAESLVLALAGGTLGVLVGYMGLESLKAVGGDIFDDWKRVVIDGRVLGATGALSLLAAGFFGTVPALQASRLNMQAALAQGASRSIAGGTRHWLRRALVIGEVALGVALLVTAGLLVRTVLNLRGLDPGFDTRGLVTASASLQDARYGTADRVNRLFDDSLARLERAPGVESAAISLGLPYERLLNLGFRIVGQTDARRNHIANVSYVTYRFFDTLRIPVRRGRAFSESDQRSAPLVIVVNETFARLFFPGEDPLGRRLAVAGGERTIVGIVGDVQQRGSGFFLAGMIRGPLTNAPQIYVPAGQTSDAMLKLVHTWFTPVWTARTANAAQASSAVRAAIADTDPQLPLAEVRTMVEVVDQSMGEQRLLTMLVGALAASAVLLASIGIYGLIAHSIAERTREIGIRMALGATVARTIQASALSGVALASAGVVLGGLLAYFSVQLVQSFLWGVEGRDPLTFACAAVLFVVVAAAASVLPALRILRLDPAATLRG